MMKTELRFLIMLLFALFIAGGRNAGFLYAQDTKHPNILFIAVDDLKPILACYGNDLVKTPNIDKLASTAMVFKANYCQQAVCAPSRASLLTGQRPDRTKVRDLRTLIRDMNPDIITLPQYFKTNAYNTIGIGKIFDSRSVDAKKDEVSWSIPYLKWQDGINENYDIPARSEYQDASLREIVEYYDRLADSENLKGRERNVFIKEHASKSTENLDIPDDAYRDGATARMASRMLEDLSDSDQAFFFAVGFSKPHLPFIAPQKYWDLYDRDSMPLAEFQKFAKNAPVFAYHNSSELRRYADIPGVDKPTGDHYELLIDSLQLKLIHGYYACVSYVDAQIGILLETLENTGLKDNTIIVLWGDHGWHLGDHSMWNKHSNLEQATISPLIISVPGLTGGEVYDYPTEFIDVFPTLCELSGLEIPESDLDGVSLLPALKDHNTRLKDYAISQFHRGPKRQGYTIRNEHYRYTEWLGGGFASTGMEFREELIVAQELYDMVSDPGETENVVHKKEYKHIGEEMSKDLHEFFKQEYAKQTSNQ